VLLLVMSLTGKRATYFALELDRSWTEIGHVLARASLRRRRTPGSIRVSSANVRGRKALCLWRGRHFGEGHNWV